MLNKILGFIKSYWKTLLFFAIVGLVGGFFVGLYLLNSYPPEIKQQLIDEAEAAGLGGFPIDMLLAVLTAVQSLGYGFVLGGLGIWLAKKIGLWTGEYSLSKTPLIIAAIVAILGGILFIVPDILVFGNYSQAIKDSYAVKPTLAYILATVTYGAVIEEVMLRLFMLSLIAFLLNKLFNKNSDKPTTAILIASNILAALLFAVGHLPTTFLLLGNTPTLIIRCLLLNGAFGLAFGYLYRKYGLRYAMLAHGGVHIVSKLIWVLFL